MVERAEPEATMEEIVVALRETRRDAGRVPPFTVVGGQPGGSWTAAAVLRGDEARMVRYQGESAVPQYHGEAANAAALVDIAELREAEIERLLGENARLNERIVFLLKVVEREQRRPVDLAGGPAVETDRGMVVRDVKSAIEAELRPVLLVLLRLLQTQQSDPVAAAPPVGPLATTAGFGSVQSPPGSGGGIPPAVRRRDR